MTLDFKNITLISLVKDNKEDSKILIDYLLVNKLKIHHIIADGSKYKQEKIFNKLKNPLKKYSYYGEDKKYSDLYKKIYFSLKKTKTKYVYFFDQGDFLNFNTLKKCRYFLDKNKDYSCSLGKIYNFKFQKKNIKIISKLYEKKIIKKKLLFDRIKKNFHFRSYHALHRTEVLTKSLKVIRSLNINEPRSAEFIIDFNNLINGKVHTVNKTLLIHNATEAHKKSFINRIHKTRHAWYNSYFKYYFYKAIRMLMNLNLYKITKKQIENIQVNFIKNDIEESIYINKSRFFKRIKARITILMNIDNELNNFINKINENR